MRLITSKGVIMVATLALLINAGLPLTVAAHSADSLKSSVIRVAPPAPTFTPDARLAELANRRARVGQAIGDKGVLILFSTEPRIYANDVDYEYRQENNLYYLTNLKQKNATLVLTPGNPTFPAILFLPRRNPPTETW